jgi:hypothetical protein
MDMNMHSSLFKREEVKPESAFPEYGGTHELPYIMPMY